MEGVGVGEEVEEDEKDEEVKENEEEDWVVGTTTAPVEVVLLDEDVDVEGWTKVMDVATATPA